MSEYKKAIMNCIVNPIIDFLEKENPKKHYEADISQKTHNNDTSTTVVVKEKGMMGMFGEIVCTFTNNMSIGSTYTSNNKKLLPQEELEKIIRNGGTYDIDDVLSSAEFLDLYHRHSHN